MIDEQGFKTVFSTEKVAKYNIQNIFTFDKKI